MPDWRKVANVKTKKTEAIAASAAGGFMVGDVVVCINNIRRFTESFIPGIPLGVELTVQRINHDVGVMVSPTGGFWKAERFRLVRRP